MDEARTERLSSPGGPRIEHLEMTNERAGVLIIRAWIEEGSSEPLRAEVRLSTDASAGFERTATFSRAEAVGEAVQAWLGEMLANASGEEPPVVPATPGS